MCSPWKKTFTLAPLAPFLLCFHPNTIFGSCKFLKFLPKQKYPKPLPKHIKQEQVT